jgi:hypothetical protein
MDAANHTAADDADAHGNRKIYRNADSHAHADAPMGTVDTDTNADAHRKVNRNADSDGHAEGAT